jgi:hypothetical protein
VLVGPALHIVYGAPVDPRLTEAFALYDEAFALAMRCLDEPAEPLQIPLEDGSLPGISWQPSDMRANADLC